MEVILTDIGASLPQAFLYWPIRRIMVGSYFQGTRDHLAQVRTWGSGCYLRDVDTKIET